MSERRGAKIVLFRSRNATHFVPDFVYKGKSLEGATPHKPTDASLPVVAADVALGNFAAGLGDTDTVRQPVGDPVAELQAIDNALIAGDTPRGWHKLRPTITTDRPAPTYQTAPEREDFRTQGGEHRSRFAPDQLVGAKREAQALREVYSNAGVPDDIVDAVSVRVLEDESPLLQVPRIGEPLTNVLAEWRARGMPQERESMPVAPEDVTIFMSKLHIMGASEVFDPEMAVVNHSFAIPVLPTALPNVGEAISFANLSRGALERWSGLFAQVGTPFGHLPYQVKDFYTEQEWATKVQVARMKGLSEAIDAVRDGAVPLDELKKNFGTLKFVGKVFTDQNGNRVPYMHITVQGGGHYLTCDTPGSAQYLLGLVRMRYQGVVNTIVDGRMVIFAAGTTTESNQELRVTDADAEFTPIPQTIKGFDVREFAALRLVQDTLFANPDEDLDSLVREMGYQIREQGITVDSAEDSAQLSLVAQLDIMERRAVRKRAIEILQRRKQTGITSLQTAHWKARAEVQEKILKGGDKRNLAQRLIVARNIVDSWEWSN